MPALMKREARDVIRRDKLNLLTSQQEFTLFGTGDNAEGDPASTHPTPDNAALNSQIDLALDYINRKCRLGHVQDVEIDIDAQTADGPFAISLRTSGTGTNNLTAGDINEVRRAYFEDSSETWRLLPKGRESFDSQWWGNWQNTDPATPQYFWIEGYTLYLWPAPSTAGTLHLIAGTGVTFVIETASLEVLPNDYHDVLWNCAAWFVARNHPNDAEMLALSQQYAQLTQDGVQDILKWKRDVSSQEESPITMRSDRIPTRREKRRGFTPDWRTGIEQW